MPFPFFLLLLAATYFTLLLPLNEEVLLLFTLSTMFYTLYTKLPSLVAPYFDGQNAELLGTYRRALEAQRNQLREALTLFQAERALLRELDSYADWSLLRLNLILQLRQEKGAALVSQELASLLSALDQDRKALARSFLELSQTLWGRAFSDRLQKQDLSDPTLFTSPQPHYPFLAYLRLRSLVRRGS